MKRLKIIECKNEQKLETIKDQGKRLLNSIRKHNEKKSKIIEKNEKIVYLKDRINKLLRLYPNLFNKNSINLMEVLARNERIHYKNLSYKFLFNDDADVK